MKHWVFIGDQVSAAGFRLAGMEVYTPPAVEVTGLFQQLQKQAQLIVITAELASHIQTQLLQIAINRGRPLLVVIPDVRGHRQPADLIAEFRRQLGMGA